MAEQAGQLVGFGAALERAGLWFLAELFVGPAIQSSGAGRTLLGRLLALATPGLARATMASGDPRAQGLYARAGMAPRWPALHLAAPASATGLGRQRLPGWSVEPVDADALITLAARGGYRLDPRDLGYWQATLDTDLLAVTGPGRPGGPVLGAVVIRRNNPFVLADPRAATFGPVVLFRAGSTSADPQPPTPGEALDALAAATWWLRQERLGPEADGGEPAALLRLLVPGPHPALAPLLDAGLHIVDVDTHCASSPGLLDPRLVCPSQDLL